AGMFIAKPFTEYTEADFAAKISLNLAGFFHVSQRAVRQMLAQAGGHIVNVTTTVMGAFTTLPGGGPETRTSASTGTASIPTRAKVCSLASMGTPAPPSLPISFPVERPQ